MPDHNLHLTLVFLGDQSGDRLAEFEAAAGEIEGAACMLELDRFGWFPRARVAWLGGDAPEALGELQGALWRRMVDLGVRLDERPFRPHVTLFRQVLRRPRMPDPDPLIWPVGDFVLVESVAGSPYRVLRRWALEA